MAERGISFSAPMVRALMAGTKTQTRRVVKQKNVASALRDGTASKCCPFHVGDRLWVREAYRLPESVDALSPSQALVSFSAGKGVPVCYEADGATRDWAAAGAGALPGKRRAGMFMPRLASRILLEVIDVRVERLDACSAEDAVAEGIERVMDAMDAPRWRVYGTTNTTADPRQSYRRLWEQINGVGSWGADPLVWVVVFRLVTLAAD